MPFFYCGNRNLRLQPPTSKALNFALRKPGFLFILELFLLKSLWFSVSKRGTALTWKCKSQSQLCSSTVCESQAKPARASGHHFTEKVFSGGSNANRNKGAGKYLPTHIHCPQNLVENSLEGGKDKAWPWYPTLPLCKDNGKSLNHSGQAGMLMVMGKHSAILW